MSDQVISKKRAARIERRKAKIASVFNIDQEEKMGELHEGETEEPSTKRPRLSDEEYQILRKRLKDRKRALQHFPLFRLVQLGLNASLNVPKESRLPILVTDVQSLLLFTVVGDSSGIYYPYRWCTLTKWNNLTQTVVLVVDGISVLDFEDNKELFPEMCKIFEDSVEMCNPLSDEYSLSMALAYVPVSMASKRRMRSVYKSFKFAVGEGFICGVSDFDRQNDKTAKEKSNVEDKTSMDIKGEAIDTIVTSEAELDRPENETKVIKSEACSRLQLMLNASQLISEQYPVPGIEEFNGYAFSQDKYAPVTDNSPIFGVDCEWVTCVDDSKGLARVAVVNEKLETVYHSYVKPKLPIKDYLTRYSGITQEILKGVKKRQSDVQLDLKYLLPSDAILVGQSLCSDLKALKMFHPYVIDTSVIYNLTGRRYAKTKLSMLTKMFCRRHIQCSLDGHNPIEDAKASVELVLLKLVNGIEFGDVLLTGWDRWIAQDYVIKSLELDFQTSEDTVETKIVKDGVVIPDEENTYDTNSLIHMKFFTFIQTLNKGATLITSDSALEKIYRPKLMKLRRELVRTKKEDEPLVDPVSIKSVKTFHEAVQATNESRLDNGFTLIHTTFNADEEEKKDKMRELDKAVGETFNGISLNGIMIVIFGGSKDGLQNGACFIRINKPRLI